MIKKLIISGFIVSLAVFGYLIYDSLSFNSSQVKSARSYAWPVLIHDEGREITCLSSKDKTIAVIADCGLKVYKEDIIKSVIKPSLGVGSYIEIKRATPVYLRDGAKEQVLIRTQKSSVGDFLQERGISLGKQDKLSLDKETALSPLITIEIDRFGSSKVKEREDIAYKSLKRPDPDTPQGQTYIGQEGKLGELERIYKVTYKNNKEIKRKLLEETVVEEPQPEIVYYGTMPPVISTRYGAISIYNGSITASNFYDTGDKIKITNLANGRSVTVTVDSGCPHCGPQGRLIDLRKGAFDQLVSGSIWSVGVITNAKVEHLAY
jgi:uncharacterized protein YabE (DUF348 family)